MIVLLLVLSSSCHESIAPTTRAALPPWHVVESQLRAALGTGALDFETVIESAAGIDLIRAAPEEVWLEMTAQTELTWVPVAGFTMLRDSKSRHTFPVALRLFDRLASQSSLFFTQPLWDHLEKAKPDIDNQSELDAFARTFGERSTELARLLAFVNVRLLAAWANRGPHEGSDPILQAYGVDASYVMAKRHNQAVPDNVANWLRTFAALPGIRRSVYLCRADNTAPEYRDTLTAFLRNEELERMCLMGTLIATAEYIRNHVPFHEIGLSEARVSEIEKVISRFGAKLNEKQ